MENCNEIEFREMCCEEKWKELAQDRQGFGINSVELYVSLIRE
jgi:hypothetical protein